MTKQSVAGLVDELERMRYVRRVPDPMTGAPGSFRSTSAADEQRRQPSPHTTRFRPTGGPTGARRFGQLRDSLEDLREITEPFGATRE